MYNSVCQSSRFIVKKVHDNSKSQSNITIGLHLLCNNKLHVHIMVLTDHHQAVYKNIRKEAEV